MYNTPKGFGKDFLWGAATAACQIEGAAEYRGLTASDVHLYDPKLDRKNLQENELTKQEFYDLLKRGEGEGYFPKRVGNKFYTRYQEDINLMKEMGFSAFRFSIAWSRIFPTGKETEPNKEGIDFYDKLIDAVVEAGMEPVVTIMHYDIPNWVIVDYGGFANPKVIDLFMKYSELLIRRYQDRVKYWIPFNQINLIHYCGFKSLGIFKDAGENFEELQRKGIHNQFICNAKIKKLASELNPDLRIGVMLADLTYYPRTCHPKDVVLTMKRNRMQYFFADVNLRGEYPKSMLRYLDDSDIKINITEEDKQLFKENKLDFLAVSYYYSRTVDHNKDTLDPSDVTENPYLKANDWGWTIDPDGFYNSLCQYGDHYGVPIIIAENGFGYQDVFEDNTVHDQYRIDYLKEHIIAMKEAVKDGVDIFGYLPWAPVDLVSSATAEMSKRYGFVYVDADDMGNGTYDRYPKDSFYWYKDVIKSNGENL